MDALVRPIQILVVEDNPADVELMEAKMWAAKLRNIMHTVQDGEAALDFLLHRGVHEAAPVPDVVLLDLHLPRRSGLEVLRAMRAHPRLHGLPVVVLSGVDADRETIEASGLHVSGFVPKPLDLNGYRKIVEVVDTFWLAVVKYAPGATMDSA